jgi:YtcA family
VGPLEPDDHQALPSDRYGQARRLAALATLAGLAGCRAGAPSLSLVGAYFPAWILCSLIGLAVGLAARAGLSATRIAEVAAYPLVVCIALGAIAGLMAWLVFYRG